MPRRGGGYRCRHLVDPALAAVLLGIDAAALLRGKPPQQSTPADRTLLGGLDRAGYKK